jgi:hypothetical protein
MELGIILGNVTYIVLCICAWVKASGKGRFGFGYFLLSLFFTPIIGLILAYVVSDKKKLLMQPIIINNVNHGDISQQEAKDAK